MESTEENTTELGNKKLNEIKYELEICKAEITNLKERINQLEKHTELKENKFRCIKDLVIWTDEDTNKKELFRIPYGFNVIKESHKLGSLHEYLQGYYYLQNIASMLSAIILDPKPNEIVIDMCAAPGSKSTHLAQLMDNKGTLILIDKYKNRIPALNINLRRMGIINSIVLNMDSMNLSKLKIT